MARRGKGENLGGGGFPGLLGLLTVIQEMGWGPKIRPCVGRERGPGVYFVFGAILGKKDYCVCAWLAFLSS